MVTKLFKYEFSSFMRAIFPFHIIIPIAALILRIVQIFEENSGAYAVIFRSSLIMFIVTVILALVMTVVTAITRYYKNLFSNEGYLSFTLPVTERAHILTKLAVSLICLLITIGVILASCAIATFGQVLNELCKAAVFLVKYLFEKDKWDFVLIAVEFAILVFTAVAYFLMLFYFCITIGQTAKKNRILAAFGVYFAYYILTQVVGTVFIALYTVNDAFRDFCYSIIDLFVSQPINAAHLFICSGILFFLALGSVFYFVSHRIMVKKLNLE